MDLKHKEVCISVETQQKAFISLEPISEQQIVYNMEIGTKHTYYIGKQGNNTLAHNAGCWDSMSVWWAGFLGGFKKFGQGVVNTINGIQDIAISTVNLGMFGAYNATSWGVNQCGGDNPYISIPSPDWSRGLITEEYGDPGSWSDTHGWSKFTGGSGVSLAFPFLWGKAGLPTKRVVIGKGESFHVAYNINGKWYHGTGGKYDNMSLQSFDRRIKYWEKWLDPGDFPIINTDAAIGTLGTPEWTCVTTVIKAFLRGGTLW